MKLAEVVERYIMIRDRRAQRKKEFTEADVNDKLRQEQIEAKLLEVFNQTGMDGIKTPAGTAYTKTSTSATIADKESFFNFVKENEEWALLEVRGAKLAIEQYKETNQALPPGVNWREEVSVEVRRN